MTENFTKTYANFYDPIYQDRRYEKDRDFIEGIFQRYSSNAPKTLLDFGSGTGTHALYLTKRGFDVTGVELSPNMRSIATAKAKEIKSVRFLPELPSTGSYQMVTSLFAVLNYLPSDEALLSTLDQFNALSPLDATLVFDTWNGFAVPFQSERYREKPFVFENKTFLRSSQTEIDWRSQTAKIEITVRDPAARKELLKETHLMRFYTPREIESLTKRAGWRVEVIFNELSTVPATHTDYTHCYVCRKIKE